jgi:hypothetical protein
LTVVLQPSNVGTGAFVYWTVGEHTIHVACTQSNQKQCLINLPAQVACHDVCQQSEGDAVESSCIGKAVKNLH